MCLHRQLHNMLTHSLLHNDAYVQGAVLRHFKRPAAALLLRSLRSKRVVDGTEDLGEGGG